MLLLSVILIFVYIFLCSRIKDPLLKKIIVFLVLLYGIQISLAIWDPYNIYKVSYLSVALFNIQIICLILGVHCCKKSQMVRNLTPSNFMWPSINVNPFMLVVISVLFLYSYYNYNRMQSFLTFMASTSDEGREYYFTSFFPTYTLKVIDWFLTSFKYVAFFVSITLIFNKGVKLKLKDIYFVVLTIASYALLLLTSQSRTDVFVILLMLIFMTFVSSIYDVKRYKTAVLPFMIIAVIGIGVIFFSVTLLRTNLTSDGFELSRVEDLILEQFATYFYVPILAFDYTKDTLLNFGFPFFGCATFSAFLDTLLLPLTFIDHSFGEISMNTVLGNTIGIGMYFPSGKHWMAMFTGCANYYIDLWYLGFIVYPMLHGWMLAKLVYTFRTNVISFMVLAFLFYVSFIHATSCGIQSISTVFFLLWVWMVTKSGAVSYRQSRRNSYSV